MPVTFSYPQHPSCLYKRPPVMPPPLLPPRMLVQPRGGNLQTVWTPVPRVGTLLKPKKIIRIKDPETGHDITEEILSSASVGRTRNGTVCDLPSLRMPPPVMKPALPLVLPCSSGCMSRPFPQQLPPPPTYCCPQCQEDFQHEMWQKKNGAVSLDTRSESLKLECPCLLCQRASSGNSKLDFRRQYYYSRKFLMKLRHCHVSQIKPKGLPDFILRGLLDANDDKENQLASGDHT